MDLLKSGSRFRSESLFLFTLFFFLSRNFTSSVYTTPHIPIPIIRTDQGGLLQLIGAPISIMIKRKKERKIKKTLIRF